MITLKRITTGPWIDCTTGCLLDYNCLNNYYKMIEKDLSKQQALSADPNAIQQINFTGCLAREGKSNTVMFLIIEKVKDTILIFSHRSVKLL